MTLLISFLYTNFVNSSQRELKLLIASPYRLAFCITYIVIIIYSEIKIQLYKIKTQFLTVQIDSLENINKKLELENAQYRSLLSLEHLQCETCGNIFRATDTNIEPVTIGVKSSGHPILDYMATCTKCHSYDVHFFNEELPLK